MRLTLLNDPSHAEAEQELGDLIPDIVNGALMESNVRSVKASKCSLAWSPPDLAVSATSRV